MGFWIFSICISFMIPLTMIGFGYWMYRHCPPRNAAMGYRTTRSMKNSDTWKFANQFCGRLWYFWGRVLFVLSVILLLFLIGKDNDTVGNVMIVMAVIQLIILIGCIVPTERALKKIFDQYGLRIDKRTDK